MAQLPILMQQPPAISKHSNEQSDIFLNKLFFIFFLSICADFSITRLPSGERRI